MISRQCVLCTRTLSRIVKNNNSGFSPKLRSRLGVCRHAQVPSQRTFSSFSSCTAQYSANNLVQYNNFQATNSATPYLTVRFYNSEKSATSAGADLPIHLVNAKVDLTQTVKHQLHAPKDEFVNESTSLGTHKVVEEKPRSVPEETDKSETVKTSEQTNTQTSVKEQEIERVVAVVVEPRPSLASRSWSAVKNVVTHYYDGSRLLVIEIRISARLSKKIFKGDALSRRERRQLTRTVGDVFRLVPMSVFIMIPFMELLLPVALYFFPNMLPSTFESIDKRKENKLKKLKLKLDLAKFIQESMVTGITLQNGKPYELEKFSQFIARTRSKDPRDDIEELLSFSKLFSEDLTLDNLPRSYLVALSQMLNMDPGFNTDTILRFRLRNKMRNLKEDDMDIRREGLETMTGQELQNASNERGMRSVGVSVDRLRNQLDQWLILSLEKDIPMTLLLLSRAMTLPAGHNISYDDLRNAVAHLPDSLIGEAKITLAAQKGEKIDNRSRLDAVVQQEEMIKAEESQQAKKVLLDSEKDRIKDEEREKTEAKEVSNTRVAANLQMRKETLKDMSKPILTEDQIEITQKEVAEIQQLIAGLRDKKNPLLEEKEELRDLVEKALVHHITVEEGSFKASTGNKLLSNKVAKMLNRSHKVLSKLEASLQKDLDLGLAITEDNEVVLKKQEVKSAIDEILSVSKKEKLLAILEVLPLEGDRNINTSDVLKGLEKIATEGTDLRAHEISALMKLTRIREDVTSEPPQNKS